jgi:hypothetical protein
MYIALHLIQDWCTQNHFSVSVLSASLSQQTSSTSRVMDGVLRGEYSMTCSFLGDEGGNCANQECNKHWGNNRGAKVCPHCGHTEQMWRAAWVEHLSRFRDAFEHGIKAQFEL